MPRAASTHLPPAKDRALATALLKVSDRTFVQESKRADQVIYCGDEGPIHGWTNAVPNPKYTEDSRPRLNASKKRKNVKKLSKYNIELLDSSDPVTFPNVSSNVDGKYQSYATLRNMYDNYKKTMRIRSMTKRYDIIDPVTFEYVPLEERTEHDDGYSSDGSEMKLPVLKMSQSTETNGLMDVVEKYAQRSRHHDHATDDGPQPIEILDYYDKYRWNFREKDKQKPVHGSGFNRDRMSRRHKRGVNEKTELPPLGSSIEPSAKEKLLRYVNGSVRHKDKNSLHKEGKNSFYIKFRGAGKNKAVRNDDDVAGMIKFERKQMKATTGGDTVDRWIARVIIKNPDETRDGARPANTNSTSSVVILTENRWPRKTGVAESERERLQKEMQRARREQKAQQIKKQRDKAARNALRRLPSSLSVVETAKVKMRYDVETSQKKGTVREVDKDDATLPPVKSTQTQTALPVPSRDSMNRNELSSKQDLTIGKDQVTRIVATKSTDEMRKTDDADNDNTRVSRLFLNRGAALKRNTESRLQSKQGKIKLPVLPKQAPMQRLTAASTGKSRARSKREVSSKVPVEDASAQKDTSANAVKEKIPSLSTMKSSMPNENEADVRAKTPSSTFNSGQLFQQVIDTAHFLKNAPGKGTEFIRYKVIEQPGLYPSTHPSSGKWKDANVSGSERRPLHPPYVRNRGHEKIQDFIDQEKALMRSVIEQLNATGKFGIALHGHVSVLVESYQIMDSKPVTTVAQVREQDQTVQQPMDFKAALTSAFATAKTIEESKANQVPQNLVSNTMKGNVVMKRRVVPPIATAQQANSKQSANEITQQPLPMLATAQVGEQDEMLFKEGIAVTGPTRQKKKTKAPAPGGLAKKRKRIPVKLREDELNMLAIDNFVCSGDVLIKQRPTPQLLENKFAASISAVKPARRVVNVVAQKG